MRHHRRIYLFAAAGLTLLLAVILFDPTAGTQGGDQVTRFKDATTQLNPPFASNTSFLDGWGSGVALGDYDNDGDLDIYFPNNGNPSTLPPFLNGSFPPGMGEPTNIVDPEGDGAPNALYENVGDTDGDGLPNFVDVAAQAGVEDRIGIGHGAVFADFDNDGDLDLYVANGLGSVFDSEFGLHGEFASEIEINGFRDPGGSTFPPFFRLDTPRGQFNGEFSVVADPATGRTRGEGRNTLFKNLLAETGAAQFVDITEAAGAVGGTRSGRPGGRNSMSVAVADVNRDGFLDLYVANFVDTDFAAFARQVAPDGTIAQNGENLVFHGATNRLYINNGDLTFTDVTETAGVGTHSPFTFMIDGTQKTPFDPRLRDARGYPVGEPATNSWAVAFNDYDHDGAPDLWVANDVPFTVNLFRNDTPVGASPDQVKFTDIGVPSGVDFIGNWMGLAFGDIDADADLDVFVSNFGSSSYTLTHNTNPAKQIFESGAEFNRWSQNARLHGLFRNDGTRLTQINGHEEAVGIFPNIIQTITVEHSRILPPRASDPANIAPQKRPIFGGGPLEFAFGAVFFDYNNDNYDDLYFIGSLGRGGDGLPGERNDNPGRLLVADGSGGFRDLTVEAHVLDIVGVNYDNVDAGLPPAPEDRIAIQFHENGRAVATGDLNNDGFPDLVLTNAGGFDSNLPGVPVLGPAPPPLNPLKVYTPGPTFIFINEGNSSHWLKVRLVGEMTASDRPNAGKSNRNGIGAFLRAEVEVGSQTRVLVREVRAGESYFAANSTDQIFGLGAADRVKRLEVRWPSGTVDVIENTDANQTITIKEGEGVIAQASFGARGNFANEWVTLGFGLLLVGLAAGLRQRKHS